jgi:putative transcriptional regulator
VQDKRKRPPLAERIRHAKGEITLKTTIIEMPDPPPEISAKEITNLRLKSGMSQADFAGVLNVSTKTVQSWEQGQRRPSHAALRLIEFFLSRSVRPARGGWDVSHGRSGGRREECFSGS